MAKICIKTCIIDFKTEPYYFSNKIPKCRNCEVVFLDWEGIWCPCCSQRLSRRKKISKHNHGKRY